MRRRGLVLLVGAVVIALLVKPIGPAPPSLPTAPSVAGLHGNTLGSGGLITWYTVGLAAVYGIAELVNSSRQGSRAHSSH